MNSISLCCFADNHPKFLSQAVRLGISLHYINFFDNHENQFVVGIRPDTPDYFILQLKSLGAKLYYSSERVENHGPSNKMIVLNSPDLVNTDYVVLSDCDVIFLKPFNKYLNFNGIQCKIADMATVKKEDLQAAYNFLEIDFPKENYITSIDREKTILYCNAGLLIWHKNIFYDFITDWFKYNTKLIQNISLLKNNEFYCDQVSLSVALSLHQSNFKELPVTMNFPTHIPAYAHPPENLSLDPSIIHYHSEILANGKVKYFSDDLSLPINNSLKNFNSFFESKYENINQRNKSTFSNSPTYRKQLIIAGFYESGISLMADSFQTAGVYIDKSIINDQDSVNLNKQKEDNACYIHENIYKENFIDWKFDSESPLLISNDSIKMIKNYITAQDTGHFIWGLEDPRANTFLNLWDRYLSNIGVVVIFRHWAACADSMWKKYAKEAITNPGGNLQSQIKLFEDFKPFRMWLFHNKHLLSFIEQNPNKVFVVSFDAFIQEKNIGKRILNYFDIPINNNINGNNAEKTVSADKYPVFDWLPENLLNELNSVWIKLNEYAESFGTETRNYATQLIQHSPGKDIIPDSTLNLSIMELMNIQTNGIMQDSQD